MRLGGPGPQPSLARVHVLVVEDDARFAGVLAAVLAYCGARATVVPSAGAALRLLESVVPGVIVVGQPVAEATAALLAGGPARPRPPALAITAGGDEVRRTLADIGFQACLPKPVELAELCRVVGRLAAPPAAGH
ncbi:MAG TPA: hypothetical protein VFV05_07645 [Methylomirabilota bacterium]|nr:hypothetical protein [Methylomirabilota bacterium]